ncbi:uncharacterized protein TRIADDRAFT_23436 [Trichoplax adhaerens]|uniref:polynucleotide adenylyltransferase n=1 Tax=Trichoplax adhaerens TaxID=10228 RepID=B3RVW4_TRIAD|nr:hypothetical protein TRIADDRAFT_23436 [Trichoplax adhaerens]EDV26068.1 hypothetical protein TRIADDRAFT_23436 [Trichoplax adhaerens]|eukprot:XP_002112101.1 hypothetical protein TRIADDRAFT_23436 [Trichoplax adhaerens]
MLRDSSLARLHEEIIDFYQYISPRPEEKNMRETVVEGVKEVILTLWPHVQVEVFGSFRTGLYLPTSDIDLVIFGIDGKGAFEDLEKALMQHEVCDRDNIKCIHNAMVPIIKLTEKTCNYKMDIEFNIENSVKSADIIQTYIRKYEPLKYLVLVLKQFLFQRELNEVFSGGVSSYTLVMMVVNFLQLHPRRYTDHPEANYGVLLIEFFELYGRHFNYHTTCIRVRNGGQYLTKEEVRIKYQPSFLCIEDPALFSNDIGKGSFRAAFVKQSFDYAYSVMSKAVLDNTPYPR